MEVFGGNACQPVKSYYSPPIFGRAAITLGIGPHSSLVHDSWIVMIVKLCYPILP